MRKIYYFLILSAFVLFPVWNLFPKVTEENHKPDSARDSLKISTSAQIDSMFSGFVYGEMPGYQTAIIKDGEIVYSRTFGYANLDEGISITKGTIFHVASVSKEFTAFAVWLLAQQGKLNIDDDIRKYLDYLPDFGKKITIRQLINHTSGLRDQWELLQMSGVRLDDVITQQHIIKLLSRQRELNFEPGAEFLYSNSGYTLLAEIVSKVSGQDFTEFTKENIFIPLGMKNTNFHRDHEEIVKNRALSYYKDEKNEWKYAVLSYANVGATSLHTTAEDLCLWINNFFTGKAGGKENINGMYERGILNSGDTVDYAFGLSAGKYKGHKLIQHSGADAGFRTQVAWFPDDNIGIVVLGNMDGMTPFTIYTNIADLLLSGSEDTKPVEKKEIIPYNISEPKLKTFEGVYYSVSGTIVELKTADGKLSANFGESISYELTPLSENKFHFKTAGIDFEFDVNNSAVKGFSYSRGKQRKSFKKIESVNFSDFDLKQYAGRYYSEELGAFYDISATADGLNAMHIRNDDVQLKPVGKDLFSGKEWWLSVMEFYRDGNDKVAGFRITGSRARGLKFERIK